MQSSVTCHLNFQNLRRRLSIKESLSFIPVRSRHLFGEPNYPAVAMQSVSFISVITTRYFTEIFFKESKVALNL